MVSNDFQDTMPPLGQACLARELEVSLPLSMPVSHMEDDVDGVVVQGGNADKVRQRRVNLIVGDHQLAELVHQRFHLVEVL